MATPPRSRHWALIAALVAVAVAITALVVVLAGHHTAPSAAPITDTSLCSDVNSLGSDPNNYEYRYLELHYETGQRMGFELACKEQPDLPVTAALARAPAREQEWQASVT